MPRHSWKADETIAAERLQRCGRVLAPTYEVCVKGCGWVREVGSASTFTNYRWRDDVVNGLRMQDGKGWLERAPTCHLPEQGRK